MCTQGKKDCLGYFSQDSQIVGTFLLQSYFLLWTFTLYYMQRLLGMDGRDAWKQLWISNAFYGLVYNTVSLVDVFIGDDGSWGLHVGTFAFRAVLWLFLTVAWVLTVGQLLMMSTEFGVRLHDGMVAVGLIVTCLAHMLRTVVWLVIAVYGFIMQGDKYPTDVMTAQEYLWICYVIPDMLSSYTIMVLLWSPIVCVHDKSFSTQGGMLRESLLEESDCSLEMLSMSMSDSSVISLHEAEHSLPGVLSIASLEDTTEWEAWPELVNADLQTCSVTHVMSTQVQESCVPAPFFAQLAADVLSLHSTMMEQEAKNVLDCLNELQRSLADLSPSGSHFLNAVEANAQSESLHTELQSLQVGWVKQTNSLSMLSKAYHDLAALESHLDSSGRVFKTSAAKSSKLLGALPTNLQMYTVRAGEAEECVYATVSVGAPSAHALGFKGDDLSTALAKSSTQIPAGEAWSMEQRIELERAQFTASSRASLVMPQAICAAATAAYMQIVSAAQSGRRELLQQYRKVGMLMVARSLLSISGKEAKMLGDYAGAFKLLSKLKLILTIGSDVPSARLDIGNSDEYTVKLSGWPGDVSEVLAASCLVDVPIRIYPVLLTVGVNEQQTKARLIGDLSQELLINQAAVSSFEAYLSVLKQNGVHIEGLQHELAQLAADIQEDHAHKNLSIFSRCANISEQLGAGMIVSCKSAKDRTSMLCTLEAAQRVAALPNWSESVAETANTMRSKGARIHNCKLNVGKHKYAFNAFQVQFLPKELRPPDDVVTKGATDTFS